MFLIIFSNII